MYIYKCEKICEGCPYYYMKKCYTDDLCPIKGGKMELKDLKIGEYFTLKPYAEPKENQLYIRREYDRTERKYCCGKFADISYSRMLKGDTIVYTDFTF